MIKEDTLGKCHESENPRNTKLQNIGSKRWRKKKCEKTLVPTNLRNLNNKIEKK